MIALQNVVVYKLYDKCFKFKTDSKGPFVYIT